MAIKTQRAIHVYYGDTIDAKIASSLVYEYVRKYKKDISIFKYHKAPITNFNDVKKDDMIAVIGCDLCSTTKYTKLIELSNDHEVIWAENNIDINHLVEKTNDFGRDTICALSKNCGSLTLNLYEQLLQAQNKDIFDIYESIILIDNFIENKCVKPEAIEFMHGMMYKNFSAKNFFRLLYENSETDIFDLDNFSNDLRAIQSAVALNKKINNIIDERNVDIDGFEFELEDQHKKLYTCYAYNTRNQHPVEYKLKDYDVVCAFYRDENYWNYNFYFADTDLTYAFKAISRALNNKNFADIRYSRKDFMMLVSDICLFEGNISKIVIKKKQLLSKQKMVIEYKEGE